MTMGDITYAVSHGISQDRMTEGSYDVMRGSSSLYVTTLINLVTISISIVVVEV